MSDEPWSLQALGSSLEGFHKAAEGKYHFRCPICGDSAKDKKKTRGGIIRMAPGSWAFNCLNCFESMSYLRFLKLIDPSLYREERLSKFKTTNERIDLNSSKPKVKDLPAASRPRRSSEPPAEPVQQAASVIATEPKKQAKPGHELWKLGLVPISYLDDDHAAVTYLRGRALPSKFINRLYFSEDFNSYVRSMTPNGPKSRRHLAGIVMPWLDEQGVFFGAQCRNIDPECEDRARYKSFRLTETAVKCFGLELIDRSKKIHIFEGVFDAAHVKNSVAVLDAALHQRCAQLGFAKSDAVIWYDDEVRSNKQIREMKAEAIAAGYTVACYGRLFRGYGKDLNDIAKKHGVKKLNELLAQVQFLGGTRARLKYLEELK